MSGVEGIIMLNSKEITGVPLSNKQAFSERDYLLLEKEMIQFKEKTYEKLQQYNQLFELLEEENQMKHELLQQLKSAQETISFLEQKTTQLENTYKKNEKELRALKKSKLGSLTIKYWALRKRFSLRKRVFQGVDKS